eukprot:scpid66251/ scgid15357/ Uncharacterized protein C11orf65
MIDMTDPVRPSGEASCGPNPSALADYNHQQLAALCIQNAWRAYTYRRTFEVYRRILSHRAAGDPARMLRTINPREAQLFDKAAGVHVKFRLGGDTFPPAIYYRIYTHRPVEDMCANSPKDYTKYAGKQRTAREQNLKLPSGAANGGRPGRTRPDWQDKEGWYQRWENNGWRLVADTPSFMSVADPVTASSNAKRIIIHHDKAKRREEALRQRKKKKIEWMVKLYQDGFVKRNECPDVASNQTSDDGDGQAVPAETDEEFLAKLQQRVLDRGSDSDSDAEDLLVWSAGLDFDEYLSDWQSIGTSAPSDLQREKEVGRLSSLLMDK